MFDDYRTSLVGKNITANPGIGTMIKQLDSGTAHGR